MTSKITKITLPLILFNLTNANAGFVGRRNLYIMKKKQNQQLNQVVKKCMQPHYNNKIITIGERVLASIVTAHSTSIRNMAVINPKATASVAS